jgi:hypothetical protein
LRFDSSAWHHTTGAKIQPETQIQAYTNAEVAQLVEHLLAKEKVAGSSPVFRSIRKTAFAVFLMEKKMSDAENVEVLDRVRTVGAPGTYLERLNAESRVPSSVPHCVESYQEDTMREMTPILRYLFVGILIFSLYHLVRDLLQTFEIHNPFTNIFHRSHEWCSPYCNFVTYPLDLLGIVGSWSVLRRNILGIAGIIVLLTLPFWLLASILP